MGCSARGCSRGVLDEEAARHGCLDIFALLVAKLVGLDAVVAEARELRGKFLGPGMEVMQERLVLIHQICHEPFRGQPCDGLDKPLVTVFDGLVEDGGAAVGGDGARGTP
jgi:hypothetical protein